MCYDSYVDISKRGKQGWQLFFSRLGVIVVSAGHVPECDHVSDTHAHTSALSHACCSCSDLSWGLKLSSLTKEKQ